MQCGTVSLLFCLAVAPGPCPSPLQTMLAFRFIWAKLSDLALIPSWVGRAQLPVTSTSLPTQAGAPVPSSPCSKFIPQHRRVWVLPENVLGAGWYCEKNQRIIRICSYAVLVSEWILTAGDFIPSYQHIRNMPPKKPLFSWTGKEKENLLSIIFCSFYF